MSSGERNGADSPASKAFAARLAKYAYRPTDASTGVARSLRSSPRRPANPATSLGREHSVKQEPESMDTKTPSGENGSTNSVETPRKLAKRVQVEVVIPSPSPTKRSRSGSSAATVPINAEAGPSGPSRRSKPSPTPTKRSRSTSSAATTPFNAEAGPSTPPRRPKPSPKKPRPYAGPEVYAHLKPVTDYLKPGLDIIFCGINPGKMSSTKGHHFAHPTNKFWRALHSSGLTSRLLDPSEDHSMPDEFSYGLTNLCGRPTSEQSELSTLEMRLNVLPFTLKLIEMRARVVCFVGKKIWDVYESVVSKTAKPGGPIVTINAKDMAKCPAVKMEPGSTEAEISSSVRAGGLADMQEVKLEPPDQPRRAASASPRKAKKDQPAFDWTRPRVIRLPLPSAGPGEPPQYTYFWVVPSTSGLERTPMAEQIQNFAHLRAFSESLRTGQAGAGDGIAFVDIDVDGVRQTSEAIASAAAAKASRPA